MHLASSDLDQHFYWFFAFVFHCCQLNRPFKTVKWQALTLSAHFSFQFRKNRMIIMPLSRWLLMVKLGLALTLSFAKYWARCIFLEFYFEKDTYLTCLTLFFKQLILFWVTLYISLRSFYIGQYIKISWECNGDLKGSILVV